MRSFKIYIILCLFLIQGCSINFKTNTNIIKDLPDLTLGDFKYVCADKAGIREWELRASEAKIYNSKNQVYLYNLVMTFYNESNIIKSFLSANSGFVNKDNMNLFAEGKVKILSENQAILEANKVNWDNTKKQFYSEPSEFVTLKKGNTIISGYNMVADSDLKEVTIERGKANIYR